VTPKKKWTTELNRTFSREEIHMSKKHMKKCLPSLAKKEMQIITILRFLLTSVRIATIKEHHQRQTLMRMWRKKEPSYTFGGNVS
jgi:hypothetical protein